MEGPPTPTSGKSQPLSAIPSEHLNLSTSEIEMRTNLVAKETRDMAAEVARAERDTERKARMTEENERRVKLQTRLPWQVLVVSEILELPRTPMLERSKQGKEAKENCDIGLVVKPGVGSRTSIFLPHSGLIEPHSLYINALIGCSEAWVPYHLLPPERDMRATSMELVDRPTDQFKDIGGLEKQITEIREAIVLPLLQKETFQKLGIAAPKGILLFGPPGTGKTLLARSVAHEIKGTFLRMSGTSLIQMYIGEGAKLVREIFDIARAKAPTVIFIDEIDSIGRKRSNTESGTAGNREVNRIMIELLNQLDGFQPYDSVKVIAATNRVDILDPALMRSGRLDRKVELPHPDLEGRLEILRIHSRKMRVHRDVDFEELAFSTEDFNGAQCRAVCVEAGMVALRRDALLITHADFAEAVLDVMEKKKNRHRHYYI